MRWRRDPDAQTSLKELVVTCVLCVLGSTVAAWLLGHLGLMVMPWMVGKIIPNELAIFLGVNMAVIMGLMCVVFYFIPGPARRREEDGEDLRRRIREYQARYPDAPPVWEGLDVQ